MITLDLHNTLFDSDDVAGALYAAYKVLIDCGIVTPDAIHMAWLDYVQAVRRDDIPNANGRAWQEARDAAINALPSERFASGWIVMSAP
jgi:hypothetical protein